MVHQTTLEKYADANWLELLAASITDADRLAGYLKIDTAAVQTAAEHYPLRINPYFLALISDPDDPTNDPIGRQAVPSIQETRNSPLPPDPSCEQQQSPVANLIHRYPDRVVFMVSDRCAMYCRFCMRKRTVGRAPVVSEATVDQGLAYIKEHKAIQDVILSGGDPLLLTTEYLTHILRQLAEISHVQILRIHTRVPGTLPQRITPRLVAHLAPFQPLYLNIHFNHPGEITPTAAAACNRLADAGIVLGSQTVMLKGVNDNLAVLRTLMRKLARHRVRPYYLHHPDPVRGTDHFRLNCREGLALVNGLQGHISGLCVPHYMIDLPGGGGKRALSPTSVDSSGPDGLMVRNYQDKSYFYPG